MASGPGAPVSGPLTGDCGSAGVAFHIDCQAELATLVRRVHEHISDGVVGYLPGGILVVDSNRVRRTASRQLVVAAVYGKMGNRDISALNKDLRGYGIARNVRTIRNEAARWRHHDGGITGAAGNFRSGSSSW